MTFIHFFDKQLAFSETLDANIGQLDLDTELCNHHEKKEDTVSQPLIDPLSQRELEVLGLVAQGLSNDEISQELFLPVSTVKGHNLRIFGKLQAKTRTEAVARS